MRTLKELPDDLTLIAYAVGFDGEETVRLYRTKAGRGIVHTLRTNVIFETDVDSALNRGYWRSAED